MAATTVAHQWRVRLLAGAMARQIDAIPADASALSRRAHLGHVKRRARNFVWDFYGRGDHQDWRLAYHEAEAMLRPLWWDTESVISMATLFPLPH